MPKIIENLDARLMEEAKKQVLQSGYGAMTIRSVAKGCGVGIGTVYNYYPSKDALLAAYMLEDWKACMAAVQAVSAAAGDARDVVCCMYDQLCGFSDRHRTVFQDEAAASAFAGSFSRYHGLLRSQLAAPLEKFCQTHFAAEFIAEALLTWTMAGTDFEELYGMIQPLF